MVTVKAIFFVLWPLCDSLTHGRTRGEGGGGCLPEIFLDDKTSASDFSLAVRS